MLALYRHQNQGVDHLLREHPERFRSAVFPTASGKTAIFQVAAYRALRRRASPLRGVLLATSMEHIEDAFASASAFRYRPEGSSRSLNVTIDSAFWTRLREDDKIPERLRALLRGRSRTGVLTTHAQLVRCYKANILPEDLTGWVLGIDEVHKCGEDQTVLFAMVDAWYARGGTVWTVTATPFRADGRRIAPAHVESLVFTYAELAAAGILPRRIVQRLLELNTSDRPKGRLLDADIDAIADLVAAEGRPTLIQVPPGHSEDLADRLLDALKARGYTDDQRLNAVGVSTIVRKETLETLLEERRLARSQGYKATALRVAVSCKRLGEGADWVTCGHVVSIGLSTSLASVIQLLGRAARSKRMIVDYPDAWRDEVLFTILVPRLGTGTMEERYQTERLMQLACALQCSNVVDDFQRFWFRLVTNFRLPPQTRVSRAQLEHIGNVSIEEMADARMLGVTAAATLRGIHGTTPTLGAVWELLRRWDVPHSFRVLSDLVQMAAVTDPALHHDYTVAMSAVLDELEKRMKAGVTDAPDLKIAYEDALKGHLAILADKYMHLSVQVDLGVAHGLEGVLTPARMTQIVEDLVAARDAVFDLTDEQLVRSFIDPYRARYGVPPSARRATARDLAKLTNSQRKEADYDRYLRRTGFCLSRLVACRDWVVGPPLDIGELQEKLKGFHLSRLSPGLWDSASSITRAQYVHRLDVSRLFGRPEHLVGLELAAQRGWRGLPGGQTLASILE